MNIINFSELVINSRSIRKFTTEKVPESVIENAIFLATNAPSSSNMQPWLFIWINTESKKNKIAEICLSQHPAKSASDLIVVVSKIDGWKDRQKEILEALDSVDKSLQQEVNSAKNYFIRVVPEIYDHGCLGLKGLYKRFLAFLKGIYKPVMRMPFNKNDLFEVSTKSAAMAAQNFILSIQASGYDCCPMEGFDECRLKKELSLNKFSKPIMVIAVGKRSNEKLIPKIRSNKNGHYLKI